VEHRPTEVAALLGLAAAGLALIGVLVPWAWRGDHPQPREAAAGLLIACAAGSLPVLLHLATLRWDCLHLSDFSTLLMVLTLSAVIPPGLMVQSAAHGRWPRFFTQLGTLVALTVLAGSILLALDLPRLAPGEEYSVRGWYLLALYGAYMSGVVLIPSAVVRGDLSSQ
jgi:hypothetical protein